MKSTAAQNISPLKRTFAMQNNCVICLELRAHNLLNITVDLKNYLKILKFRSRGYIEVSSKQNDVLIS